MVVVVQPGVEVGLEGLDALVQLAAHGRPEELLQHRAVEALDEAVGARRADPGLPVFDVAEPTEPGYRRPALYTRAMPTFRVSSPGGRVRSSTSCGFLLLT